MERRFIHDGKQKRWLCLMANCSQRAQKKGFCKFHLSNPGVVKETPMYFVLKKNPAVASSLAGTSTSVPGPSDDSVPGPAVANIISVENFQYSEAEIASIIARTQEESPPMIEPLELESVDINQMVENDMRIQSQVNEAPMMVPSNPPNVTPGIEAQGAPSTGVFSLDINDLLKQLVATGTVPIIPVSLNHPETIKQRQQSIVDTLYSGAQCSSCGLKFPPKQTKKYTQHLDWHFRQNRRDNRQVHSRKWYLNQSDWIKHEENEDLDERGKFERSLL